MDPGPQSGVGGEIKGAFAKHIVQSRFLGCRSSACASGSGNGYVQKRSDDRTAGRCCNTGRIGRGTERLKAFQREYIHGFPFDGFSGCVASEFAGGNTDGLFQGVGRWGDMWIRRCHGWVGRSWKVGVCTLALHPKSQHGGIARTARRWRHGSVAREVPKRAWRRDHPAAAPWTATPWGVICIATYQP